MTEATWYPNIERLLIVSQGLGVETVTGVATWRHAVALAQSKGVDVLKHTSGKEQTWKRNA